MRIKLLQAYEGRQAGELTEVLRWKAAQLVDAGIAEVCKDQSPKPLPIKKEPEQAQNITVNNYYPVVVADDLADELPDETE